MGKNTHLKSVEWLCSQFGAREFYSIPRALSQVEVPAMLITDLWCNPNKLPWKYLSNSRSRFHSKIGSDQIKHFNSQVLMNKLMGKSYSDQAFSRQVADFLEKHIKNFQELSHIFSYSYTSYPLFEKARALGLKTVLGQINPGPLEAEIVVEAFRNEFGLKYKPNVPDISYWELWQQECNLSDSIVVNSKWSKELLIKAGIEEHKIKIIPLAFEKEDNISFKRSSKRKFEHSDPLKLLYLGAISVRKGFPILKRAMERMKNLPVKLILIGGVNGPSELIDHLPENIEYLGRVSPTDIDKHYKQSDLFILPTLSDGFARTLLEAQYWKLPVITTPQCGEVIEHMKNGILLDQVSEEKIIDTISLILDNSDLLPRFSENSNDLSDFTLEKIGRQLIAL